MDYNLLHEQMNALIDENGDFISNLANASALIKQSVDDISWVGFYLIKNNELILGPFQGKVACTNISLNKGVCGAAVTTKNNQLVNDTHKFKGHIACDSGANSEIVINIFKNNCIVAVLDIDSYTLNRFTQNDLENFEKISLLFEQIF